MRIIVEHRHVKHIHIDMHRHIHTYIHYNVCSNFSLWKGYKTLMMSNHLKAQHKCYGCSISFFPNYWLSTWEYSLFGILTFSVCKWWRILSWHFYDYFTLIHFLQKLIHCWLWWIFTPEDAKDFVKSNHWLEEVCKVHYYL